MSIIESSTTPGVIFRIQRLLPSIVAGLVIGFTEVIIALSLAALIFSGPATSGLPRGIGLVLITSAIHQLFAAYFSSLDGMGSHLQDNPSLLLALAVGTLGTMGLGAQLVPTIMALIVVATLLTGGFLILLGYFQLGGLVRYIPYPVIGGFLAGLGWLVVQGSFGSMSAYNLTFENLPLLLTTDQIIQWLPGVIFGVILFIGSKRLQHNLTLPAIILGAMIVFYVVLFLSGLSIQEATQRGLLLGAIGGASSWQPLPIADLTQANWGALLGQAGTIGAVLALIAISLLLNISGLELALRKDVDLNRELQVVGAANLLSGLAGGAIGYASVSQTILRSRMGASGRTVGLVAGGMCLLFLLAGSSVLVYIPKSLLGGLLLYVGLDFLDEWVLKSRRRLGRTDYAVVLFILVTIAFAGFLVGVGIGLVLMIVLFVINYSRLNLFHRVASGAEVASHVSRGAYHERVLKELGKQMYIVELQGFIFFGTANLLLERIRQRLADKDETLIKFLIVDFRRVNGLDSSAVFSFVKVKHQAEMQGFALIFTHLTPAIEAGLMRGGLEASEQIKFFADLDHGVEWCEERLLEASQVTKVYFPTTLALQLADSGFKKQDTEKLRSYLEELKFAPGDYLMRQSEDATELFFVEIGQVSVYLELDDGKRVRMHTLAMGTVVGELGFFLNVPRSASVIADVSTIAYSLKRGTLETMMKDDPSLAFAFQGLMVRLLAERLVSATDELVTLNR